jgi:hypothetical protein
MKFALIVTLFGLDAPDYHYAIDTNMQGLACIEALEKHQALLEQTFYPEDFELVCVMDDMYED